MLLAFIFVMSGVGSDVTRNVEVVDNDIELSSLSQYVFTNDDQSEEIFSSDEGNIFSTLGATHSMRNPRVNIRRKCGGNGWDFVPSDFYLINRQINTDEYLTLKMQRQHHDGKDYLIKLCTFII